LSFVSMEAVIDCFVLLMSAHGSFFSFASRAGKL
jgi:hypothetical protein